MARLVDVSQQRRPVPRVVGQAARAPVLRPGPVADIGPGIAALGGSLTRGSEEIFRAAQIEEEKINTLRAEEAYNDFLARKTDLTFGEENGFQSLKSSDAVSTPIFRDWGKKLDDVEREIAGGLANDQQRRQFARRAEVGQLQFKEDILRYLAGEGKAYAEDTYDATIALELRSAKADWASPRRVDSNIERIKATIDRRAEEMGWSPDKRKLETEVEIAKIRSSVAESMMDVSPLAARRYMEKHAEEIDPANFTILRNRYVKELDRYDRLADEQRKEDQDRLEENRLLSILEGDPVIDKAALSADLAGQGIRREQFERLSKALEGEGVRDDPEAVIRLDTMADEADPTVIGQIISAVDDRSIKPETAAQIHRRFLTAKDQGGVLAQSDVRRARAFVDDVIGGVRGPLAILDSASSERVARAKAEFDMRVVLARENDPSADPMAVARDVTKRYRLSPPTPTAFPRPRFLVGSRAQPDIQATINATLDALASGVISRGEAARELASLEEIKAAADEREERRRERQ